MCLGTVVPKLKLILQLQELEGVGGCQVRGVIVGDGNLPDSQTGGFFYNKWWREILGIHRDYQMVTVKL